MENKELKEKPSPTEQVTSTVKKKKKKDPGRIAAGQKLAEHNKKASEAIRANKEIPNENNQETSNEQGSFSLTKILSVVSIVVSLAGLYYKRKELMSFVKPERRSSSASERRGARTVEISEENLERLRECQREAELERQRESEKKSNIQN